MHTENRPRSIWIALLLLFLVLSFLLLPPSLFAQSVTADKAVLSFGKERSVRASVPFASGPGTALLIASVPIRWQQPTVGNYYASASVGAIVANQLLTADLLAAYGCQATIFYEAPNHPFLVQSINAGGTVQVGGRVCGSNDPVFTAVAFGRPRLTIACNSPIGKVLPGMPTSFTIPIPPEFTGATFIRIDFGTTVIVGGASVRLVTLPVNGPVMFMAVYPSDQTGPAVVRAVLTTGSFLEGAPMSLDGGGLLADGATISGAASFATATRAEATAITPPDTGSTMSGNTRSSSITLNLRVDPLESKRGKAVTLHYEVTNTGDAPLSNIDVRDDVPVGATAILGVGETRSFTRTLTIPNVPDNTLRVSARVSATADPASGGGRVSAEDAESIALLQSGIQLVCTVQPDKVKAGKKVTYSYTATNSGQTELNADLSDDGFGAIASMKNLASGERRTVTRDDIITGGAVHRASVVGVDAWNDQVSATCTVTAAILNPNLKVTMTANGAATTASVNKGDKVQFAVRVENTGDCDLENVKVVFEGRTIQTYDLLSKHSSRTPRPIERTFDQSTLVSVNALGRDPGGDLISAGDKIDVQVSDGLLGSLLDKAIGNARSLMNQMVVCSTKAAAARAEFHARMGEVQGAAARPCRDARLRALLTEARGLLQCVKDKRDEVVKLYGNDIRTAAEVVAKKINVDDIAEFLFTAAGQVSDTEQRVKDMEQAWSDARCGDAESETDGTCPEGQEWNATLGECVDLVSAIDSTSQDDSPCADAELSSNFTSLSGAVAEMDAAGKTFDGTYQSFKKLLHSRNANPCGNVTLAAAFVGCERSFAGTESIVAKASDAATQLLYFIGICPKAVTTVFAFSAIPTEAMVVELLRSIGSTRGNMRAHLAEMKALYGSYGCDTTAVRDLGNTVAGSGGDPVIPAEGGDGAKELCGDGLDNDGDGLIDEGCAEQSNANVTVYLFDSGSAKDDVFNLSVSGQGDLGNTPAGGARSYPLTLGAGAHVATVTVIQAPDGVGTFTITIAAGSTVLASQSGGPAPGGRVAVPFTVGAAALRGEPESGPPPVDFDAVTQQEKEK